MGTLEVQGDLIATKEVMFNNYELYYGSGSSEFLFYYGLVPQTIDMLPSMQLFAYFENGIQIYQGNQLPQYQISKQPVELFVNGVNRTALYSVVMVDTDAQASDSPKQREKLQWLVINISGEDLYNGYLTTGDTIKSYETPVAQKGVHRVVIVVLEQFYGPINCDPMNTQNNFSVRQFAAQFNLGKAVAANFFLISPPANQGGIPAGR